MFCHTKLIWTMSFHSIEVRFNLISEFYCFHYLEVIYFEKILPTNLGELLYIGELLYTCKNMCNVKNQENTNWYNVTNVYVFQTSTKWPVADPSAGLCFHSRKLQVTRQYKEWPVSILCTSSIQHTYSQLSTQHQVCFFPLHNFICNRIYKYNKWAFNITLGTSLMSIVSGQ